MRLAILAFVGIPVTCCALAAQEHVDPAVLDKLDGIAVSSMESENGWPLYEDVLRGFRHLPAGAYFACKNVPGSLDWKPLGTWLNQNRDALPALVTASRRDRYGMSYHPSTEFPGPIATVSLLHARLLVNLLCVAAREAEADGLLDRAVEYALSAFHIGVQIADRPTLTDQMIGFSLIGIASRETRRLLVDRADVLSTEQIHAISTGPLMTFVPRPVEEVMCFEQSLFPQYYADEQLVRFIEWSLRNQRKTIESHIDGTRTVLAIIGYRSANGRYPESLDAVESGLLEDADRYRYSPPGTHGLVLYRLEEDGEDIFGSMSLDDLAAGRIHRAYAQLLIVPVR